MEMILLLPLSFTGSEYALHFPNSSFCSCQSFGRKVLLYISASSRRFLLSPHCSALLVWSPEVDGELEALLVCPHYFQPALESPWLGCRGPCGFCFCLSCCRLGTPNPGSSFSQSTTRQTQTLPGQTLLPALPGAPMLDEGCPCRGSQFPAFWARKRLGPKGNGPDCPVRLLSNKLSRVTTII